LVSKIAQILEILGDGDWHNLLELQDEVGVSNGRLLEILGFLSKYEFLKIDYVDEKARIAKKVQDFMAQKATL
jgi:hypothetical protein